MCFKVFVNVLMSIISASKHVSLSVKFTTLLARPLFLRGKLYFRTFQRVKNITSNLSPTPIFSSENVKKFTLKFEVM
jgi:hypothetical protein